MLPLSPLLALLTLLPQQPGDAWPAFRGDGSGTSAARAVPVRWTPEDGVAWRVRIPGYGQSSPVVHGERVFVTSVEGAWMERCQVHAFALADGERLWTHEQPASQRLENYFRNSRAAPTCVVDDERVVAFFASGDVLALSHDGEPLWHHALVDRHGVLRSERGLGSSLAHSEDTVFVLVDHEGPSYLLALDESTGAPRWKAERGVRGSAWSSPVVARDAGLVLVSSAGSVEAYRVTDGERLWSAPGLVGNRIPSASLAGDRLYVGATPSVHQPGEGQAVGESNRCLRLTAVEGRAAFETLWTARRADPHYATPLAYQGGVYYVSRSGVLRCLDAATGATRFARRVGEAAWCSPLGVAGHVYLFLKDGQVLVLRPGPEYVEVATNRLWPEDEELAFPAEPAPPEREPVTPRRTGGRPDPEAQIRSLPLATQKQAFAFFDPVVYGAAVVEGHLLVRTGHELFCVRDGD